MRDQIVGYIREHPGKATSVVLAETFLKFKAPDPRLAQRAVTAILSADRRCSLGDDGIWHATTVARAPDAVLLVNAPWAAVSIVTSPQSNHREILHIGIWSVFPEPQPMLSAWLVDPQQLSNEERLLATGTIDPQISIRPRADIVAEVVSLLEERIPVYLSSHQQSVLSWTCMREAESLNDNAVYLSRLLRAADITPPRPLSPEGAYREVLGYAPPTSALQDQAGILAQCAQGLFARLIERGIETVQDLDEEDSREITSEAFAGKAFALKGLTEAPQRPGVYAFTKADGAYLYIGKSTDLRRRLLGYFRPSEESPQKLERLRSESHGLTLHPCGSELESLVYEYRLIRKHRPLLNTQVEINERKGSYRPIEDCVILLPHADEDKGMSFWFRKGKRVALKPFPADLNDVTGLLDEIRAFFFAGDQPPTQDDFPEQEIVFRWVKRHWDALVVVPVHNLVDAEETVEAMRSLWGEVRGS